MSKIPWFAPQARKILRSGGRFAFPPLYSTDRSTRGEKGTGFPDTLPLYPLPCFSIFSADRPIQILRFSLSFRLRKWSFLFRNRCKKTKIFGACGGLTERTVNIALEVSIRHYKYCKSLPAAGAEKFGGIWSFERFIPPCFLERRRRFFYIQSRPERCQSIHKHWKFGKSLDFFPPAAGIFFFVIFDNSVFFFPEGPPHPPLHTRKSKSC